MEDKPCEKVEISEAEIKNACEEWLQYQQNLGNLFYLRLNSGRAFVKRGDKYYAIQLCEAGTADFFVLKKETLPIHHIPCESRNLSQATEVVFARIIFLEIKSAKGKLRTEQKCFKTLVEGFGAEYYIIRSIEELAEILK